MSEFLTWNTMPRNIASLNGFAMVTVILKILVKLWVVSAAILFIAIIVEWIETRYFTVTENDEACDQDHI